MTNTGVPLQAQIESALEEYAVPMLEIDGGGLEVVAIEGTTVFVRFTGNCRGCPGQAYTLDRVVGPVLRKRVSSELRITSIDSERRLA